MTDITGTLSVILTMLFTGFVQGLNTLDSITFFGLSLLDYIITIFLLGAVIPLIFTLLKAERWGHYYSRRIERRKGKNKDD